MKLSAQFSFWMGIVFTLFAGTMAVNNLLAGDAGASAADLATARGYAMFWFFFAAFGLVMVVVSWLMAKGKLGGDADG